jgi:hypothetical protein
LDLLLRVIETAVETAGNAHGALQIAKRRKLEAINATAQPKVRTKYDTTDKTCVLTISPSEKCMIRTRWCEPVFGALGSKTEK